MTVTDRPPLDRQYGESRKSYRAFKTWLRTRSIRQAAKQLGKSRQLLEVWSVRNSWVARREAAERERRRRVRRVEWMETYEPTEIPDPPLEELDRLLAEIERRKVRR